MMAGQEAHVYKYADRSQLFYQCQISITIKEPNAECARPQCSEPQGFGAVKTGGAAAKPAAAAQLRLLKKRAAEPENTVDVRTDISALEISDDSQALPVDLRHRARLRHAGQPVVLATVQDGICMSPFGFSMFMGLGVALVAATIVIVSFKLRPIQKA
ncbi:unnamed protein product [Gongylonema pulchrum]|uniref:ZP domain-containing protein n=1 Tax=Gongylonema pulchrum TaxID=637853 RepID=A0A3P6RW23_9BILA|nr:unnamed protein product [Gongylonema pulchrum]